LSIDLTNLDDLTYVAKVYVGSDKQGLDVVYDTGSDYLVLQSSTCSTCVSDKFNPSTSTTYAVVDPTTKT
jgi:Eukaryotic aspartyl protease